MEEQVPTPVEYVIDQSKPEATLGSQEHQTQVVKQQKDADPVVSMVSSIMTKHQRDVDRYEAKIDKLKAKISDLKQKFETVSVLSQHSKFLVEPQDTKVQRDAETQIKDKVTSEFGTQTEIESEAAKQREVIKNSLVEELEARLMEEKENSLSKG